MLLKPDFFDAYTISGGAQIECSVLLKLTRYDYQSMLLKPDFFDAYTISGGAQIECSVLLKAICSVLRTPIASIDHLRVHLPSPNASKIQWRLDCDNDIARGVGEIHAAGVVCKNIKPSNVLLDVSACAVISDYGLPLILKKSTCPKSGSESDSSRIHSCMDFTLLSYTAPEVWEPVKKSLNLFWDDAIGISAVRILELWLYTGRDVHWFCSVRAYNIGD
ncbi:hypothetical protein POM88_040784 [Heracleum sosnowskyi]|uniref:Protein kinase domain-containing protein n=1 Tax=Heracleum sosnowskyi TaxID=360622 RepID=A0AAD8MAP3_9APIA|nr:hypothetical protein POM88_040784 [Heracleum sosnowskyi]